MTEVSNVEKMTENREITKPGEILQAIREKQGVTRKEIGLGLNLPERFIEYLENGDFDKLPGHTFARGYIRNYAKLLKMENAEELVSIFDSCTGTNALGSNVNNLQQIKQIKHFSNNIYWLISFVIVLVVIGVIFIWWQSRSTSISTAVDNAPIVVESTSTTKPNTTELTIPLSEVNSSENTSTEQVTNTLATNNLTTDSQSQTSSEDTYTQAAIPAASIANEGSLQAKFTANCWLTVNDANGNTLVSKLMTKGTSLTIKGKPPLEVILGAPNVASLTYNGQPVAINAKSGTTHRLKLGQ